jgi:single-strand DNA-binding protein
MAGWQQIIIVGNLGRDAEMQYLQSGTPVVNFNVAVTEAWTDNQTNERREKTTWFRVAAWGRLGENIHQYLTKGKQVMVLGTIDARAYMDRNNQPAASLELRARDIRLLGTRGEGEGRVGGDQGDYDAPPDNMGDIPF